MGRNRVSTQLWGIVNTTPDSFSDGGKFLAADAAVEHGKHLAAEGAHVLDIGGESTRPGSERIAVEEEQRRVLDVIERLAGEGFVVSVDTMNASTASLAVKAGARYVNDVSGGAADPEMLSAVAEADAEIVLGHWRGHSADMYANASYDSIGRDVARELQATVENAQAAGIAPARIAIDPGLGFAKKGDQNWALLRDLGEITALGYRVMLGTSRKGFLTPGANGHVSLEQRDHATATTSALAVRAGVWALRVHNVAINAAAVAVAEAWQSGTHDHS